MPGKRKNTGLGKGLEALFADTGSGVSIGAENTSHEDEVANISIHRIKPNEEQPRKNFDREKIHELAVSIQQHGVIQPIIVCPEKNGSYEIVAGERRWRAAREAGLEEIPCLVRKLNDEELALFAIVENMQREDLNPVEEAEGLDRMIHSFGMTQQQVSESVGKSRPYITNALRLLKLDTAVKDLLREGKLSTGHARALLSLPEEMQRRLAERIIKEKLSVRQVEQMVNGEQSPSRPKPRPRRKSPDVIQVEDDLKNVLGTKVNLKENGKKGKIEIEYYSREELDRLIELLHNV